MTRSETLAIPFGELLNLIAIDQIKNGIAKLKKNDEDEFERLLGFK